MQGPETRPPVAYSEVADLVDELGAPIKLQVREPIRNVVRLVRRNEPCPCGSGRKFKTCHRGVVVRATEGG